MKSSNDIFSQNQNFKAYLEGKLSKNEVIDFENSISDNPFLKDAFEGYQKNDEAVKSLSKLEANTYKYNSSSFTLGFYSLVVICSFMFVGGFVFNLFTPIVNELPIVKEKSKPSKNNTLVEVETLQHIDELSDDSIEASEVKKEEKQVNYKTVLKNHTSLINDSINNMFKKEETHEVITIDSKPIEKLVLVENKELETQKVPLVSIQGLINVNYSKIDNDFQIEKTKIVLTGLPANIEDHNSRIEESHELKTEFIAYGVYLKEVHSFFKRNKFKKALKGYKEILKQHPNDLNAHFYSALCYYNINQPQKSLEHLNIVLIHQFDTFRQEGEWYKAQVLYDLKRENEAIILLDKIILKNDFYATQAKNFKSQID